MASLRVLAFDHEGRPVQFDTWLDDLQLYLLSDSKDSVSLFDLASGAATAPPTTADSSTRSQWLTRDAAARLAIRNHRPLAECAHFGQHRIAQALYDAVVARYSSPATAALGRLLLPTCSQSCPPLPQSRTWDHFPSLDPTSLTVDLLEQHLLAAETSAIAVGAARGTPRPPFFEGCSPSPLAPSYASATTAADVSVPEDVGAASASAKRRSNKGKGGRGGGGGSGSGGGGSGSGGGGSSGGGGGGGAVGGSGGSGGGSGGNGGSGGSGGSGTSSGGTGARRTCGRPHTQHHCFSRLDDTWCAEFGDDVELPRWADLLKSRIAIFDLDFAAILSAMHALSVSAEGDCYQCVLPDPGIAAAALGASESGTLPSTAPAEAFHIFTLDSGASRCFFRDSTTLTPLPAPVPVRLADPSGGPVVARSSTVLPCPAVPSGSLSGLHLPSFSTNLVSTAALHDAMVTTTTPGGSSLYTLATEPSQVAASAQVSALGQVAASCSCRLLSHQTLLWHHRLGHPSLPCLRGMHSCLLVSGLPRSLPPLPPSPAPHCLPCVEGQQRAAPHSTSFPSTSAPVQTLHMDVWGPARVSGQSRERYFLVVVDSYTRYTTVFSLRSKGQVVDVLIHWIRTVRLQLRERFRQDLPVLRLHSDRGGEFSSSLLRDFCRGEGILQSFTLPDSPQQNGIAERRIGLVMEPHVSLPETSPTLRWTGEVGDASVFRVWGSHAFVRDMSANKLSPHAIPCVLLGFVPDAPGWQFYHPTSRRVFPSQDATFDESVPFYRLFPYRSAPSPPPPLFLAPGPPPVDPLPPQGAARDTVSGGAEPGGVESEGAETGGAEPKGVATGGAELGGVASAGGEPGGAEPEGVEPGGAASEGAESGGAEPQGAAFSGSSAGASPRLSPQQLCEWFVRRTRLQSGASGAGGAGAAGVGGSGVAARAGVTGGPATTSPGGARTRGTGAARTSGVEGAGAGDLTESGTTGAGGTGAGGAVVGGPGARGAAVGGPRAGGAGAVDPGGTVRPRPYFVPLLQQSGGLTERCEPASCPVLPVRTARRVPHLRPPPDLGTHAMALRPSSVPLRVPLPAPPESSLLEVPDPASDRARTAKPTVSRLLATAIIDPSFESAVASALVAELLDFAAACRLDYATALDDFECLAAAVPRFDSLLLAPEGDPDAPDIPTPRSYAEAITGPYSSQWQAAMDAEMASWKSTGTYVDEVPPPSANIVDGMWIFRVKRPLGSPPAFKARYVARGFNQRQGVDYFETFFPTPKMTTLRVFLHIAAQRNYELHSLDSITAFLQGSLHEEIWLRRPPGFTESFPAGTQWSLRWLVYGLRQAPHEWHDTLRTTLAALGFAPSTADPSLFLRTDTSLPLFYVLVYVDDLVFATADTEALTLVNSELQKRHTCTDLGEPHSYLGLQITWDRARRTITLTQSHMVHQVLQRFGFLFSSPQPTPLSTSHSLSAPPLDESVEPSGPYPELVGCLITSGMGLVLGGRGPVVLTSHADASWVDDSATQRSSQGYTFSLGSGSVSWRSTRSSSVLSSSCEAEIYAGAMAAQELHWLTYLLTDLGEEPRSPPQRGQLRLAYVATRANIAVFFTKALLPGDHQRFVTVLGLGRPVQFDTWLDDLQLYLLSDSKDSVLLFDLASGSAPAPPATANSATRSQWLTRDAAARLAICNHLPLAKCAHFGQHRTPQALYDAVDARYSSPATAALGRLLLPYLFPELSAFATVEELVSNLRTRDARYCATVPAEFLDRNQLPMFITLYFIVTRLPDSLRSIRDHFLSLDPTSLTVDLLEQHLLAAETSAVAEDVGAASASVKRRNSKGKGSRGGGGGCESGGGGSSRGSGGSGGGGSGGSGGGSGGVGDGGGGSGGSGGSGGGGLGGGRTGARRGGSGRGQRHQHQRRSETQSPQQLREWLFQRGPSGGSVSCPYVICTGDRTGQTCGRLNTQHRCFSRLDDAWHAEFGDEVELPHWAYLLRSGVVIYDLDFDAILSTMYALSVSAKGDCYRCVPPDPGIAAAALDASESVLPSTVPAEVLHTFTLDSGASRYFFRDSTTLTPLPAPVLVRLADPSGGPVVARSSIVLPCLAVLSGSLSSLHLPSFSTNLVSASGQVPPPCSCRLLSHQTFLWHRRVGHPSLPCLRGMHSRLLVSGLPRSLPPLPPSPAPPCLPCVEGRQRAAPHSSSFPPTTAPLQTLLMDVWGPAHITGQGRERYFLLVVDDYSRYTTVFPLRSKGQVVDVLIPWIRTVHLQLREWFSTDLRVLRLHSDRGVMEVARTSMIHAATPHFLWPFAVQYAAHQLNLWPRVSLPETLLTLHWTRKVGDASVFLVWGSRAFVRNTSAVKLSARAISCVFLGFVPDAPGWQFYHPISRRVLPSQDVMFDDSVPFYCLFPYRSAPLPPPPLFLAPDSGAARGAERGGAKPEGAEPGGAETGGAEPGGAEPRGAETGGAELGGAETGVAESEGAESGGAEPQGAALSGGSTGASPRLSPQQLREWLVRRARLWSGASGAGGDGAAGAGVLAGVGIIRGTAATGPGDPTESRAAGAGGSGAGGAGAGGAGVGGTRVGGAGAGGGGAGGAGAIDPSAVVRPRPYFVPQLQQVLGVPSSTGLTPPLLCPLPDQSQLLLLPTSPLTAPSPYTEQSGGLTERREPTSRHVSLVRIACRIPRSRPPPVPATHAMALRPSSVPLRVPLPAPPESSLPKVPDPESDHARATSPAVSCLLASAVTDPSFESAAASPFVAELLDFDAACRLDYATALDDFECLAAAVPRFASMLLAPEGDPDAPDIPAPHFYAEAITGPYSSQWQAAMDAKMASWKSTGTYVDEVPPPAFKARYVARGISQRQGVDYFQTFSPTPKMITLRVLLQIAAQYDYELHSLDFSTAFLQGSLHEEIWLRCPPGFTGTTLAALGFAPSTADPSLFLRTDTLLSPFYVLVYIDDLVFATADPEAMTLRKSFSASASCSPRHSPLLCLPATRSQLHLWTSPSSCEAEIYAGAMAAQELRWLTYLLTDLGEQPRSPSGLYVNNKAMIALCEELRLEHKTKHLALQYFLARELQQRGQLHLAYVATRANTADIFTKALPPGDHQRFSTVLGLLALLFLTGLVTTCSPPLAYGVKNEMVAGISVKGEPDEVLGCSTCMQAKFTRFPFSSSEATAKAPLDEVVMDVVGPLKLGAAGAEYFLTIVDVYTRMTWVYVLSKKSDVAETVKTDWLPMVERQQDRLVKAIRTDRGGEFLSKEFSLWLKKNDIRHSPTMPYSPAMNGIAERANRTITETARGLLIEAGLPEYFSHTPIGKVGEN
ncbi:unnamed protein product [Closterium sp. NIES-53]